MNAISAAAVDTSFFILAKLVGTLLKAETWLLLMAILLTWSIWRRRLRMAKGLSALLVIGVLGLGLFPFGDMLLRPLERRIAPPEGDLQLDGIIVLGGGEDVQASLAAGQPQLGEGGDRHVAALALAHQFPQARILFAGGSGRLRDVTGAEVSEAAIAARIFASQGIAPERLLVDTRSRNTAENARFALAAVPSDDDARWALVTSAFHMPRALRSFEAAGWTGVIAYPVDYRTRAFRDGLGWNLPRNLQMLNTAIREWVGRAAYALVGR